MRCPGPPGCSSEQTDLELEPGGEGGLGKTSWKGNPGGKQSDGLGQCAAFLGETQPKPSLHGPFYSASRSTVNESLLVSALMYHMTTHAGKSVGLE